MPTPMPMPMLMLQVKPPGTRFHRACITISSRRFHVTLRYNPFYESITTHALEGILRFTTWAYQTLPGSHFLLNTLSLPNSPCPCHNSIILPYLLRRPSTGCDLHTSKSVQHSHFFFIFFLFFCFFFYMSLL